MPPVRHGQGRFPFSQLPILQITIGESSEGVRALIAWTLTSQATPRSLYASLSAGWLLLAVRRVMYGPLMPCPTTAGSNGDRGAERVHHQVRPSATIGIALSRRRDNGGDCVYVYVSRVRLCGRHPGP
jgi:hypothetical protein